MEQDIVEEGIAKSLDTIQSSVESLRKHVSALVEMIDVKQPVNDKDSEQSEVEHNFGSYDDGEEKTMEGILYPYIIPCGDAFTYTRSKFAFKRACSKIIAKRCAPNASAKEKMKALIDVGVPIESIAWAMRKTLNDTLVILQRPDEAIYPYLRSAWMNNFDNPLADWHYTNAIKKAKENAVIKKLFGDKDDDIVDTKTASSNGATMVDNRSRGCYPVAKPTQQQKDDVIEALIALAPIDKVSTFSDICDELDIDKATFMGVFNCDVRLFTNNISKGTISRNFAKIINDVVGKQVVIGFGDKPESSVIEEPVKTTSSNPNRDENVFDKTAAIALLQPDAPHNLDAIRKIIGSNGRPKQWISLNKCFSPMIYQSFGRKSMIKFNEWIGFECLVDDTIKNVGKPLGSGSKQVAAATYNASTASPEAVIKILCSDIAKASYPMSKEVAAIRQMLKKHNISINAFARATRTTYNIYLKLDHEISDALAGRINSVLGVGMFDVRPKVVVDKLMTGNTSYVTGKIFTSMREFASALRLSGITQADLARQCKVSRQMIYLVVSGSRVPSTALLASIESVCKCSFSIK